MKGAPGCSACIGFSAHTMQLRCVCADGVKLAQENRAATYTALGTAVVLFSPGTCCHAPGQNSALNQGGQSGMPAGLRGVLFRQTLGRLRSQEVCSSPLLPSRQCSQTASERMLSRSLSLDRANARRRMWQTGSRTRLQSLASWTSAWMLPWPSGRLASARRAHLRGRCRPWHAQ